MLQCTFGWRENVQQQQPHCRRWWWWTMVPGTCRVPQKLNQVNHTHTHTHKSSNLMHSNAINFRFILMACNLVDVLHYYDFAGRAMCLCHRIHPSISHAEFILCTQPASPARAGRPMNQCYASVPGISCDAMLDICNLHRKHWGENISFEANEKFYSYSHYTAANTIATAKLTCLIHFVSLH